MAHTQNPAHPTNSEEAGHELTDTNMNVALAFGIGLAVLLGTAIFASLGLMSYFQNRLDRRDMPEQSIFADAQPLPQGPVLQINPPRDMELFQAATETQLTTYGWLDKEQGQVRIPVERAIDLIAERGLPEIQEE